MKDLPQASFGQESEGVNVITLVLGAVLLWLIIVAIGFAVLQFANPFASQVEFTAAQKVSDRQLEVTIPRPAREIVNPLTEVTVYTNKEVTVTENNRWTLELVGKDRGTYVYILKIVNLGLDETDLTLEFTDSSGNTVEQEISITRKRFAFPLGFDSITPHDGASYILDGNDISQTVSNTNRLMEDYIPEDLVDLNKDLGIYTFNEAQLRAVAAQPLKAMLDAMARETGEYVTVASGYRSYETQVKTYASWVKEVGLKEASSFSARPGHSQHQQGVTVDFTNEDSGWKLVSAFGDTAAGKWLQANAANYGFEPGLIKDESDSGGFVSEPWQYTYVGVSD